MRWRDGWKILKEAFNEFSQDDAMAYAAAIAFYTSLALAPTILLFLTVTAYLGEETRQDMINQINKLIGPEAADGMELVMRNAQSERAAGSLSAIIGICTIIFSASGIFAQLQMSLNRIWDVEPRPESSYWGYIRSRLLSIGMMFTVFLLLLASLVVNAVLAMFLTGEQWVWNVVNLVVSFGVYVFLFGAIFKFLPDVRIRWRDVAVGAVLTAALFMIGRYLIGLYLGRSALASSYGAAGSLVVLLVWVYYSAVIVLFGGELTQVYARHFGPGIRPADYAIRRSQAQAARSKAA